MDNHKEDLGRNRPSEEGKDNDPNIRDESAHQPGVSTMSDSDTDDVNQQVTKTAADSFTGSEFGKNADKTFDEVDNDD